MTEDAGRRGPDAAVILAGGGGTRLWPWTGPDLPKPLLPLGGGGRTLLGATLDRLAGVVPPGRVRALAAPALGAVLAAGEPRLGAENLWVEPSPWDTGPAVALAMRRVLAEDPAAVVAILPADHRVGDEARFAAALASAADAARAGELALLGVAPDQPSTRFGYLQLTDERAAGGTTVVGRFVEKPDPERAQALLADGALWNAGMFVWRADVFWAELERRCPEIAGPVAEYVASGDVAAWEKARRTSIDYGLMEKVPRAVAAPLDAAWDDVGGWDAVAPLAACGDAGPARLIELRGEGAAGSLALVVGEGEAEAAVLLGEGARLVVVGPRGVLVAPRDAADRVKAFV